MLKKQAIKPHVNKLHKDSICMNKIILQNDRIYTRL